MSWWRKLLESRHFVGQRVLIAVGNREDGWWQAAGGSAISPTTAKLLVSSNGETHINWVRAWVWFPRQHSTWEDAVVLEALGGSGPQPHQPVPLGPPLPATDPRPPEVG